MHASGHDIGVQRQDIQDNLRSLRVGKLAAVNLRLPGGGRVDAGFDDKLAAMAAARDEGLIAGVGLSNVSLEQLRHAVAGTDIVCVQNLFHLAFRYGTPYSRSASAAAAEGSGCRDPDALAELVSKSEQSRLLTAMAMEAATSTPWPAKVVALGRVLAAGLIPRTRPSSIWSSSRWPRWLIWHARRSPCLNC